MFNVPSGNMTCSVTLRGAACEISDYTWTPPPKPADCEYDWGGGLRLGADGVEMNCASDTMRSDRYRVLPYGSSLQVGEFRCSSARDGVRCVRLGTRTGFLLSRTTYETSARTVTPRSAPARTTDPAYVEQVAFTSPSRNVRCSLRWSFGGCSVERATYSPPPRPKYCRPPAPWATNVVLREVGAQFECGDYADTYAEAAPLPYGESLTHGSIRCTSRRDGVECVGLGSSHRFLLGSARYELG